ncbi:MAG TPA: Holliday junction resolvase RuvX [Nitrospirales bacterium]|nr:Holliday junction resolvase RuvX [Nitrospirales bacterium]HIA14180.1 Holliday junction resolvase RuvX [Nitrospirales bacterium]HIB55086.1 Holliday junction resolvase RuvX [Nitrospirales bacterium]HIC04683.1 Holliday junction resolvase RuvX [Nitrospirales bacterium]HIN34099.1 Holliday junction resolvase RuvX [Nitrospirales bacterium]
MKRALGLDHGEKRIGVSVSDELGLLAHPVDTYHRRSRADDVEYVKSLVHTYDIGTIAIGLPKHMNGDLGTSAKRVTRFIDALAAKLDVTIVAWDERLTTVMATRILQETTRSRKKRTKVVDQVASVLILQSYLDSIREPNRNEVDDG